MRAGVKRPLAEELFRAGREAERQAVVAWLREYARFSGLITSDKLRQVALLIEQGRHLKEGAK